MRESVRARPLKALRRRIFGNPTCRDQLLDMLPRHAVCAEIGVWRGDFSARILRRTQPARLHLIDPWAFQPEFPDRAYGGSVATGTADMDRLCQRVADRFASAGNVSIHRGYSDACLNTFDDGYFDWVYIDGNHCYDFVRRDIEISMRKVRSNGWIAGDDFDWGESSGFPVRRAIHDVLENLRVATQPTIIGTQFLIQVP